MPDQDDPVLSAHLRNPGLLDDVAGYHSAPCTAQGFTYTDLNPRGEPDAIAKGVRALRKQASGHRSPRFSTQSKAVTIRDAEVSLDQRLWPAIVRGNVDQWRALVGFWTLRSHPVTAGTDCDE